MGSGIRFSSLAMRLVATLAVSSVMLAGCGSDDGADAAGTDVGQDTGGVIADTGGADGAVDTGSAGDTGQTTVDTTAGDAGPADVGAVDAGPADVGAADAGSPDAGSTPTCAEMSKKLQGDLAAAVAAHNSCSASADCTIAQTSTACAGACGQAVNKTGKAAVDAVVADLDVNLCKANGYAGKCGYSTPSCLAPNPACEAGKCVYVPTVKPSDCTLPQPAGTVCANKTWVCKAGYFQTTSASKACMEATCSLMIAAHGEAIGGVAATINKCSHDTDCIIVATSTACQGACGVAVNKAEASVLEASIAWADANICKANGYAAKCGFATPKCVAPKPGCAAGVCVYAKAP